VKGQFFISSVVVIAVILILSMSYANSAEELRLETGNDLEFNNYENAYENAVPDDWEFVNYLSRNKIGICVTDPSDANWVNLSVQFSCTGPCENELNASVSKVGIDNSVGTYLILYPSLTNASFDSLNCTEFHVYSDGPPAVGSIEKNTPVPTAENGTKFDIESINISPNDHLVSIYREKNIFVNETDETNKVYTVSYRSNTIDYTGEL